MFLVIFTKHIKINKRALPSLYFSNSEILYKSNDIWDQGTVCDKILGIAMEC